MKILVLGGTVFVGRAFTDAAIARGHSLTHLNRGKTAPGDPRVKNLHADRTDRDALRKAIGEGHWDAVLDTSGYLPQVVRNSAELLRHRAARYLFVSSISVYAGFDRTDFDEDAPVSPAPDPLPDTLQMELYGPLKSACEMVVRDVWGEAATIVRPGLIVGPHDPTDRFTYWPVRLARGGDVLSPGRPQRGVQFIDVRDLAEWMLSLLEGDVGGTFNATGPSAPLSMGEFLEACREVAAKPAQLRWIPDDTLIAENVGAWKELPLWIPDSDPMHGLMSADIRRALARGLRFRPLRETIADTLSWANARPADHAWKAGLAAEREVELLRATPSPALPPGGERGN